MGTDKRARQKANRQKRLAEVEAEQASEVREQSTRRFGKIAIVVAGIIGLIVLLSVLRGGDEGSDSIALAPTPGPESEEVAAAEPTPLAEAVPADFEAFAGSGALATVAPSARANAYDAPPPMTIDSAKNYVAVMKTDAGTIRLELFADAAPVTVNNFVNLARDGYYDGVGFHRVLEGFMAQGGDPTGTGSGGPGYSFEDEFDPTLTFDRRGLLAMANAGPATNGSQFFITFVETPELNNKHTIFGQLANPDDPALDRITLRNPNSPDASSITPTVIESIQILEA